MMADPIIVADFDRARQDMLQEFRRLIAVDSGVAAEEAKDTANAIRQLLELAHAE